MSGEADVIREALLLMPMNEGPLYDRALAALEELERAGAEPKVGAEQARRAQVDPPATAPDLREHLDCAVEIAERLSSGEERETDVPTLVAHLHVMAEDWGELLTSATGNSVATEIEALQAEVLALRAARDKAEETIIDLQHARRLDRHKAKAAETDAVWAWRDRLIQAVAARDKAERALRQIATAVEYRGHEVDYRQIAREALGGSEAAVAQDGTA